MGNSQSPPSDHRFTVASRAFSKQELADLKSLYISLAAQSKSNTRFVSAPVFQGYFRISGALAERLFDLVTQGRRDGMITYEDLVITKATYEMGTREEVEEFIYQLCDVTADGVLTRSDLEAVLTSMMEAVFKSQSTKSDPSSNETHLDIFLNTATFSVRAEGNPENMSFINFKDWCSLVPSVRKFLGSLLLPPDSGRSGFQIPYLQYPESLSSEPLILKKEYAWHIGGIISQHQMEWKLLYHSAVNGLSFNTFLSNVLNDGPTVLIIKDKEGYTYGGYASQSWEKHGDFYGDMKSFIFKLHPQASIFRPTGANNNTQWCAVNFSSDGIPNGVGFGGKPNHFGLFLSASLEQGHTYACSTFDSPCLSKTNKIHPQVIECWGIVTKKAVQDVQSEPVKGTILERFKEDRNMLKMVGLANSSE